jgi:PmbA protein
MDAIVLREIGERLMRLAKRNGATDAIVSLSSGVKKEVSVRDGLMESTEGTRSANFTVTAIIGERRGVVRSSSFADGDMENTVTRAISLARIATKNPHLRLATPYEWPCRMEELPSKMALLDACDDGAPPTLLELKERASTLDTLARSEPGVARSGGASFGYGAATNILLMSNGFAAVNRYTYHNKSASVIAEQGGEMKTGDDYHVAFHSEDLRADGECAQRAASYAVLQLGAQPIATGRMPVIFDQRISRMILSAFIAGIDADNVYHQSTFLLDRLYERVFRDGVMIVEEPFLPRRLGSRFHDNEGVRSTAWTLVHNGVLTKWISSIASASKLGISPTGHASGTANLVLRPSKLLRDDMVRDISRGLLVTSLMGSDANIATGAYSVGAEGFLIENGEITRPVNRVTIAGNLRDMFRELIPASDLSDHPSGANAPSCFIPSMMVGGV